jgi:hypothetical protein
VSHSGDRYDTDAVIDHIDNPVNAHADAICRIEARQLCAANGSRVVSKRSDCVADAHLIVTLQPLESLGGRVLDLDLVRARHTLTVQNFVQNVSVIYGLS